MPYDQNGNWVDNGNGALWGGIGTGALSGAVAGTSIEPGIGTLVGGVIGAGAGLLSGESQKKKGTALLNQNQYPYQPVPQGIQQNAQQANRLALQGLPSAQYQQAMKNIQRQQQDAIVASQSRKSGMDTVANTGQQTNDAQQNLAAADTQARLGNIQSAYQQNQVLGQYTNAAFDWNQKNRYLQNWQYGQSLVGAGNQNMIRGIDAGASSIVRAASQIPWGNGTGNNNNNNSNNGSLYGLLGAFN